MWPNVGSCDRLICGSYSMISPNCMKSQQTQSMTEQTWWKRRRNKRFWDHTYDVESEIHSKLKQKGWSMIESCAENISKWSEWLLEPSICICFHAIVFLNTLEMDFSLEVGNVSSDSLDGQVVWSLSLYRYAWRHGVPCPLGARPRMLRQKTMLI